MDKIYVELKKGLSSFSDLGQGVLVAPEETAKVLPTATILRAIDKGILIEVEKPKKEKAVTASATKETEDKSKETVKK